MVINNNEQISSIVERAVREDIGSGDVTTLSTIPSELNLTGQFMVRVPGVIAGSEVVKEVYRQVDNRIQAIFHIADGEWVEAGAVIATVKGPGRGLLSCERVALNCLQRMSGIATLTRRFVEVVEGTKAVILDTRKTAPGLRLLDKMAVKVGGGRNHRFNLSDASIIKDNHITAVGSISEVVALVRKCKRPKRWIEVEVKTLSELEEALNLKVDRIMLDNMNLETMRKAVRICNGKIPLEASGNITLENVADIAATGVDLISIGMLTHSVQAMDITFRVTK